MIRLADGLTRTAQDSSAQKQIGFSGFQPRKPTTFESAANTWWRRGTARSKTKPQNNEDQGAPRRLLDKFSRSVVSHEPWRLRVNWHQTQRPRHLDHQGIYIGIKDLGPEADFR